MEYPRIKVVKLYEFVMSPFPGEENLKREKSRALWNPTFSYTVMSWIVVTVTVGRQLQFYKGIVSGLSLELKNVAYSIVRAAMDIWLGCLAVALELEEGYPDHLHLLKTGGLYTDRPQLPDLDWSYKPGAEETRLCRVLRSVDWGRSHVIMAVSWKPQAGPILRRGQEKGGRCFENGRSQDSR